MTAAYIIIVVVALFALLAFGLLVAFIWDALATYRRVKRERKRLGELAERKCSGRLPS